MACLAVKLALPLAAATHSEQGRSIERNIAFAVQIIAEGQRQGPQPGQQGGWAAVDPQTAALEHASSRLNQKLTSLPYNVIDSTHRAAMYNNTASCMGVGPCDVSLASSATGFPPKLLNVTCADCAHSTVHFKIIHEIVEN